VPGFCDRVPVGHPSGGAGRFAIAFAADPRLVYEATDAALWALRTALRDLGFVEVLPAVLSSRFEPGARHSVAVLGRRAVPTVSIGAAGTDPGRGVRVEGDRAYWLPVSHAVEKQMALEHLARLWCMTPCVRLLMPGEPSSGRHLYTFFQVEIEWRTESVADVFATAEDLLSRFARAVRPLLPAGVGRPAVEARLRSLEATPYPRVAFRDALSRVRGARPTSRPNPHNGNDLTHDEERRLSESFRVPFWLHDYPEGVRDSVYRRNASGTYDTYDLLLPEGVGEVLTGGLRAESAAEIVRQSKALTRTHHPDYAAWKDRTGVQSGGFGLGFERLVRYALAFPSVLDLRRFHDSGPNATIEAEAGT
jgi:asparaginyl-tRNA synthetase